MFEDNHSDFIYLQLLKNQTEDEVVDFREALGTHAESHSVDIKHYHAKDGFYEVHNGKPTERICNRDLYLMGLIRMIKNFKRSITYGHCRTVHAVK